MKRVEGHPHLLKNPLTGVLVNIDESGYEAAEKRKAYNNKLQEENDSLKSRIEKLEKLIEGVLDNG